MGCYIKSLEWTYENKLIFKLESISAYLQDLISKEQIKTNLGWIEICIVDNSDMQYEQEKSKIILSENTDYWVTYDVKNINIDSVSLTDVLTKNIAGKGILNSKNYVGILDIGISEFEIIVKSKKSNYERDFNFLRKSISEFGDELLSRSSSYFSEHFTKSEKYVTDKVNYADIAYLKSKLSPDKFPAWVDYFIYHAEHKYVEDEQERNISEVDEIDSESYMESLLGNQLVKTKKVKGRAGQLGKAPQYIKALGYKVTFDTNENRFVKFFVKFLRDYLQDVLSNIDEINGKLYREVEKMLQIVSEKLENPFWRNISNMENLPFNSQVLQKSIHII